MAADIVLAEEAAWYRAEVAAAVAGAARGLHTTSLHLPDILDRGCLSGMDFAGVGRQHGQARRLGLATRRE